MSEPVRLNKYISESGLCSRREADALIGSGAVTVNGSLATLGTKVSAGDDVRVNGTPVGAKKKHIYIALNKPAGITCTTDTRDPTNIVDYIGHEERIFPVGRLDKDSDGLILLTNNGDIVNDILRAAHNHEKEYIVTVDRPVTPEFIAGMAGGVPILDTVTKRCRVQRLDERSFRIVLTQGLNRQIRRMCEHFGYEVKSLTRVRIMNIRLGGLKAGHWRNLRDDELAGLLPARDLPAVRRNQRGDT
ncbi:MAG: 23S rRNA pseudouridine(2604) synthase RluF [Pseudomonadota bacterium]